MTSSKTKLKAEITLVGMMRGKERCRCPTQWHVIKINHTIRLENKNTYNKSKTHQIHHIDALGIMDRDLRAFLKGMSNRDATHHFPA